MSKTSEDDISFGVMLVAAKQSSGVASFKLLYDELHKHVQLTKEDWLPSTTRKGEPMWYQIVRNIKSHDKTEGNAVYEGWLEHIPGKGYRLTDRGRRRLGIKV